MQRHAALKRNTPLVAHTGLARGEKLHPVGSYGKRNRSADDKTRAVVKLNATCPCGCGRTTGLDWIHLAGRSGSRHSKVLTFAGCRDMHEFIDHVHPGAKAVLRDLASNSGHAPTEADVVPVLFAYGYPAWLIKTGRCTTKGVFGS